MRREYWRLFPIPHSIIGSFGSTSSRGEGVFTRIFIYREIFGGRLRNVSTYSGQMWNLSAYGSAKRLRTFEAEAIFNSFSVSGEILVATVDHSAAVESAE